MKQFNGLVKRVASILDKLAGGCFFLVMVLILGNILMRSFLGMPILGTYEIVGFLTALGIGLALAHCALQDGHIAVTLFTDRLSGNFQALIQVLVNGVSCLFWGAAAWHLVLFAQAMKIKGLVSPSAEIPVYPFIYLIAVGVAGLCLALLYQLILSCRELAAGPVMKPLIEPVKRAAK